ncbi:MAG: hypothetical protein A2X43_07160 [Candidatus Margulisbacteria bacterium GWD2_39_127]|nr:MAG: hypothetical protein A2X43_07160 [Candidatus Margulisbacteria bacterium GWD2_39_127]OGI09465.1 MAG: hypothetical protein A2X41_12570 [Candidatus Margulisbacteria bacterium GWE2_39_32]
MVNLSFITICMAGLIDGINPCAFGTVIFLLSYLSVRQRKQEMMLSFALFTIAVFVTYFLIGFGLFQFLYKTGSYFIVARLFQCVIAGLAFIGSALSFYDAYLAFTKKNKFILRLPDFLQKRIKNAIREKTMTGNIVIASLVLGFLVSIFELNCTGQIYFPSILYMIKTGSAIKGTLLLFVYNVFFVFPLIIIGLLTYSGLSSRKLSGFLTEKIGWFKLVMAFTFLALGILFLL